MGAEEEGILGLCQNIFYCIPFYGQRWFLCCFFFVSTTTLPHSAWLTSF